MNGLEKIINNIKNDNKIKYSLLFFSVLILYWIIAPWLGTTDETITNTGSIELKKENYINDKNYNLKITDNKEQRDALLKNEIDVRNKKINDDDETYIRKKYLNKGEENNQNNYNFIKRNSESKNYFDSEKYITTCKENKIICIEENKDECNNKYNECKTCIDKYESCELNKETNCKESFKDCNVEENESFNKLKNNKKFKFKKNKKKSKFKELENKNKFVNIKKEKDNEAEVYFGSDQKKEMPKNYNKYMMILSDLNNNYYGSASLSAKVEIDNSTITTDSSYSANKSKSLKEENPFKNKDVKNKDVKNKDVKNKDDFKIYPGSSYIAQLITPLNSLYKEDIRPILDFTNGDIAGFRGVGVVKYKENSAGLIILITELWDEEGIMHKVNGFGIQYSGEEMTPTFEDEIDRHLFGRIGYSVLAGISGAYGQTAVDNNQKITLESTVENSAIAATGSVLNQTFANLASSYKTEVKVQPQKILVIFY